MTSVARIEHIVVSPAHVYVGHFGRPAGTTPAAFRTRVRLLPGRGIADDRYSARESGHPKQLTFFAMEVLEALAAHVGEAVLPTALRRNVFTRGLDLPSLIGQRFRLQGVTFEGVEHCKPCFWMDTAVAKGAEAFLAGRGGLRAKILDGESLAIGEAVLEDVCPSASAAHER